MLRTVPLCLALSQRRPQAMVAGGVPRKHDADDGFESARGEFFGWRAMKFPAALLTRISSGASLQMGIDHGFDGVEIANVTRMAADGPWGLRSAAVARERLRDGRRCRRWRRVRGALSHGFAEASAGRR